MKVTKFASALGVVTLIAGFTVGCSTTETQSDANMDSKMEAESETSKMASKNNQKVQQAIDDAKAVLAKADATGFAWRDTGKMISNAEKALAAGDTAKALKLAAQAKQQSELAIKQSIDQDKAVKERFGG
jgi:hypothetical protein